MRSAISSGLATVTALLLMSCASAFAAGPHITSVSQIWARGYQTIQITGSGLGTNRVYIGDSPFIEIEDVTGGWSAGHTGDAVTLDVPSWTDTLIEITAFYGSYGTGNLSLSGGDVLSIKLWNPQTGAGPATAKVTVLANATSLYYGTGFSGTPIMDDGGNFYGVGGPSANLCNTYYACGAISELSPNSTGSYTQTTLFNFTGGSQGWGPQGTLVRDSAGNFYGTTANGGDTSLCFLGLNCGVVFEVSSGVETVLHTFTYNGDGLTPASGLVMDSAGDLYGTTVGGGAYGYGTVYELSPNGSGGFNYSIVHSFQGGAAGDGASPYAPLTLDADGNLFGTTASGGTDSFYCYDYLPGCGTVFELSPSGAGTFLEKILYEFHGNANGALPSEAVTFDPAGNLYGVTYTGGPPCSSRNHGGCGVVYMLTPAPHGIWPETTLYTFSTDSTDVDGSEFPHSALTYYNGLLYGFALGGASGTGTLYSLTPGVVNSVQTLYSFGGGYDGESPEGQPFVGTNGTLYGASYYGIDILPTTPPARTKTQSQLNSR